MGGDLYLSECGRKTRTAKVRMEFHNPGYFLKPGMFATVQVMSELEPSALLAPDMAILRSGERPPFSWRWTAASSIRAPSRSVRRPRVTCIKVLSGLNEGERIVTSGQFMLDSESQLREAIQRC